MDGGINGADVMDAQDTDPTATADSVSRTLSICNMRGLHARASAKFVRTAEEFDAEIQVSKDGNTVAATSIMGLMMLAAAPGCCIKVEAKGPDAEKAVDALEALVDDRFGEGE